MLLPLPSILTTDSSSFVIVCEQSGGLQIYVNGKKDPNGFLQRDTNFLKKSIPVFFSNRQGASSQQTEISLNDSINESSEVNRRLAGEIILYPIKGHTEEEQTRLSDYDHVEEFRDQSYNSMDPTRVWDVAIVFEDLNIREDEKPYFFLYPINILNETFSIYEIMIFRSESIFLVLIYEDNNMRDS